MEIMKQRFVIKPGSITAPVDFNVKVGLKSSPFSNGYDMKASALKLGQKVHESLTESDPDYQAWEVFKAHELLLKQYLHKDTGRKHNLKWGEYEILSKEDDRFKQIGVLNNQETDFFKLHTKQGVRMWEGNNNKKNGSRWPGVRFGLSLINELNHMAVNDNPYAQYELLKIEEEIANVEAHFAEIQKSITKQLEALSSSGLSISIVANDDPVRVNLNQIKGYGFRLVKLLTDYDAFVRSMKTLTLKGLMANKVGNEILNEGGKKIRRLLNDLYMNVNRMRAIKDVSRNTFLDDEMLAKLNQATQENILPVLPLSVLNYETLPSLIYVATKVKDPELTIIIQKCFENDLLVS